MSFVGLIPWNFILGTPPSLPTLPFLYLAFAHANDATTMTGKAWADERHVKL